MLPIRRDYDLPELQCHLCGLILDPIGGFLVIVSVTGTPGAAVRNKNPGKAHALLPSIDLPSSFAFLNYYFGALRNTHSHCRWYRSKGSPLLSFLLLETAGRSAESLYKGGVVCFLIHELICQLTPAQTNASLFATFSAAPAQSVLPDAAAEPCWLYLDV